MGLFDGILGYFQQQGQATTGQVTQTAPYQGGGPALSPSVSTPSYSSAPAPQPVQINPIGAITTWGQNTMNYIGSGIQNVSSGIQSFVTPAFQSIQSPSITNPIQQVQMQAITGIQNINPSFLGITGIGAQGLTQPPTQISVPNSPFVMGDQSLGFMNAINQPTGMSIFVPYGNQAQIQVNNLNSIVYDPVGGGFVGSVIPYGHSISNIVTSGGPGSLQSGMFSTQPLTPVVYTQSGAISGQFAPAAVPAAAALVLASPQSYSRLGAEAYGGYVAPLDNRVLTPSSLVSVYPSSSGNLAALVDPYGVNQPKQNWATMPWSVPITNTGLYSITPSGMMTPVSQQSIGMAAPVLPTSIQPAAVRQERNWLDQLNYDIGGALGIRASGLEQTTTPTGGFTLPSPYWWNTANPNQPGGFEAAFALIPGGVGFGFLTSTVSQAYGAIKSGIPTEIPFSNFFNPPQPTGVNEQQYNKDLGTYNAALASYNTDLGAYQKGGSTDKAMYESLQTRYTGLQATEQQLKTEQKSVVATPSMFDRIGGAYEELNTRLAPYTTDVTGLGRVLSKQPDITTAGIPGEAVNFIKGTYIGATQHPVDIALTFAGGEALSFGEGAIKMGVAKAAMYEGGVPVVSTVGRMASTPIATDIASVGKFALGGFILYESGANIISQPTSAGKGEAFGRTGIQFAGFGVGMNNVQMAEPNNYYAGRGFFSQAPEIGPLEKAQFKLETTARALSTEQPGAYRDVANIVLPGRVVEPMVKAEPDFSVLSKSGPYATEIKGVIVEQPHSVIGSSSLMQQYPENIAIESGLRFGKDVDVLIESPSKALRDLSVRTGLPEVDANTVMDVHPIPANYPGIKPSVEPDITAPESSMLTQMFGDPYRHLAFPRGTSEVIKPGKGYTGDLTYEAAQVQFGRKSAAVSAFIEDPLQKGYRGEKDIYDFITGYQAQRSSAIAQGVPESKFTSSDKAMQSFMERTFTYGTEKGQRIGDESPTVTKSVREIYDTMFQESAQARATVNAGGNLPGEMRITFSNRAPEPGAASSIFRSAFPSGVWGSSAFGSPTGSLLPSSFSPSQFSSSARSSAPQSPRSVSSVMQSPPSPTGSLSIEPISPSFSPLSNLISPPTSPIMASISSVPPSSPGRSSPPSSPPSSPYFPSSPPSPVTTPSPPSFPTPTFSLPPFSPPTIFPPFSPPTTTPPRTPPPFSQPPTLPSPPTIPPFFPGIPAGSGLGPFQRKRRAAFTEIFNMGLDYSLKQRSQRQGKSWTQPKKVREARAKAKKGGKKK